MISMKGQLNLSRIKNTIFWSNSLRRPLEYPKYFVHSDIVYENSRI
jgi:hypothetical protein